MNPGLERPRLPPRPHSAVTAWAAVIPESVPRKDPLATRTGSASPAALTRKCVPPRTAAAAPEGPSAPSVLHTQVLCPSKSTLYNTNTPPAGRQGPAWDSHSAQRLFLSSEEDDSQGLTVDRGGGEGMFWKAALSQGRDQPDAEEETLRPAEGRRRLGELDLSTRFLLSLL